jgi:hypothetical protein
MLAERSEEFQTTRSNYNASYYSTFETWSSDVDRGCNLTTLQTVDVVFSLEDAGASLGYATVAETPGLSAVIGVDVNYTSGPASSDGEMAGYQFYEQGSVGPSQPIYEAVASFAQPEVSQPYSTACNYNACTLGTWAGLEAMVGGSPSGLAQAGTDGSVGCLYAACITTYYMWYQVGPSSPVYCSFATDPSVGDSITVYTVDEAIAAGHSQTAYDFYIIDTTSGQSCSSVGNSYTSMSTPPYSVSFMAESAGRGSLPRFGLVNMNADLYSGGTLVGVQTCFESDWYKQYTMLNDSYANAYTGTPTYGSWMDVWQTNPGA